MWKSKSHRNFNRSSFLSAFGKEIECIDPAADYQYNRQVSIYDFRKAVRLQAVGVLVFERQRESVD